MNPVFRLAASLFGIFLALSAQAFAAEKATFLVLPFSVEGPQGYAYLERSIPQMLTSRLYWKGRVEPAAHDLPASVKPVSTTEEAEKLRARYKADYVVWGGVNVVGDDCSLDVRVLDKSGKVWPQARNAKAPQLMAAVTAVSDAVNRDVFGRTPPSSAAATTSAGPINQMHPDILVNETSSRDVYLNPQFRYSGTSGQDDSRRRSQALTFSSIGMEVVDATGDGRNEIFLLDDRTLRAFAYDQGQLSPLGEFQFPMTSQCLNVRSLSRGGAKAWIIVSTIDSAGAPKASILTFDGKTFTEEVRGIKYYLNVVKLPSEHRPIIIGQQAQPPRLFKPGVHEMIKQGNTLVPSRRLDLPSDANVFNFTYLPSSPGERDGEKLVVLSEGEQLRTYSMKGQRLAETPEKYSGSALGMEIDPTMPGFGKETVTMANVFYIPMRMLPMDLEGDGNWELLVNKPISTASQIFDRYRYFPQSELHSLFWDGLNLSLQWKTRRIKGSMVDYAIADADNDGVLDIVACLNTHPGALGVKARKTVIVLYPLDTSRVDPNTATDGSEYYD